MIKNPRSLEALVDEQVRRWNAARERGSEQPAALPVITVSREYGGRGAALAKTVSDRLGYQVWDREILQAVAEHSSAPQRLFSSLDEHRKNAITESITVLGSSKSVTASEYFRVLLRVVHTIAEHGRAVIVGRGAQYILDADSALKVRAVCPLAQRIAGIAERNGISQAQARVQVGEVDSDRSDFVREYYGRDVDDAVGYDLVVNTGTISIEAAADIVISAYRVRFSNVL